MTKFFKSLMVMVAACLVFMILVAHGYAQEIVPVPTEDFLAALLKALGDLRQGSALVIALVVSQLGMKFLQTPLGAVAGKWRLVAVLALSFVTGVLSLKVAGAGWLPALLDAGVLASFQVLAHQIYKQFIVKADEQPTT